MPGPAMAANASARQPTDLPGDLFASVTYVVNDDVDEATATEVETYLLRGGARPYDATAASSSSEPLNQGLRFQLDRVTHVISQSDDFPEYELCNEPTLSASSLAPNRPLVVTPEWALRCARLKVRVKEDHFSCRRDMIFSGLCVTCSKSQVSTADRDLLSNIVGAFGGVWRDEHLSDVNVHLTTSISGSKMQKLSNKFGADPARQTIFAAPQWISDSWRLQKLLPLDSYRFDPESGMTPPCFAGRTASGSPLTSPRRDRVALNITGVSGVGSKGGQKSVFQGKSVLLARDVCRASEQQLRSLEHFIRSSGGTARRAPRELEGIAQAVRNSDFVVCRYREVQEFREAIRQTKQVGNLSWLIFVLSHDQMCDPREEPLHFPVPRLGIPCFHNAPITISNYRGQPRQYLTKMIKLMGAKFSGSLTPETRLVVAANLDSTKTQKAKEWDIPIVNHKYIVDSFLAWDAVERAKLKYIDFPEDVDYNDSLGGTRVTDESLGPWIDDAIQNDEPEDMPMSDPIPSASKYTSIEDSSAGGPTAAETSTVVGEDRPNQEDEAEPQVAAESRAQTPTSPKAVASDEVAHQEGEAVAEDMPDTPRSSRSAKSGQMPDDSGFHEHASPERRGSKRSLADDVDVEPATSPRSDDQAEDNPISKNPAPAAKRHKATSPTTSDSTSSRSPSNKSKSFGPWCVVTSNYKVKKADQNKLKKLGIEIIEDIENAHVLVTSRFSRTPKMLYAIASGAVAILSPDWLEACLNERERLEYRSETGSSPYALRDPEKEKEYGVKLGEVLQRRDSEYRDGIYHEHKFWLGRELKKNEAFSKLIEAAGGELLEGTYDENQLVSDPEHYHLIIGENDTQEWSKLADKKTSDGQPLKIYREKLISDCVLAQQPRWDIHVVDALAPTASPVSAKRGRGVKGGGRR